MTWLDVVLQQFVDFPGEVMFPLVAVALILWRSWLARRRDPEQLRIWRAKRKDSNK